MIVALHAATGAATGALTRSRLAALVLGPPLHVAADRVPHRHPAHSVWEYLSGALILAALARRRGAYDAATVGAAAAMIPDLEHLLPRRRPRRAKFFHRRPGADRHDSTGLSARTQMLAALIILAPLLAGTTRRGGVNSAIAAHEAEPDSRIC